MKLSFRFIKYAVMPLLLAVLIFSCTNYSNIAGGTTETTSATVAGTIWYDNSTRAPGVTVKLIPAGFNPFTDSGIDSVVTNENGDYSFTLNKSGYFNVIAQKQNKYCYTDSIFCQQNNKTVVNDTLENYGSVEGTVKLAAGSSLKDILVLVMGTNIYVIPDSISGKFTIPIIAQGNYVLRLFSPEKLYAYFDTLITVSAGQTTKIADIEFPFINLPELKNIKTAYEPKTMLMSISWPAQDTSDIVAYYVYRNSNISGIPLAVINSPDTTFTDDLLLPDSAAVRIGDIIQYRIAAIGKDRTIKKVSAVQNIPLQSTLVSIDTLTLPDFLRSWNWVTRIFVDNEKNIYLYGWKNIAKFNPAGQLVAQYTSSIEWFIALCVDKNGCVYAYKDLDKKLLKFTPNLQLIKETALNNAPSPGIFSLISRDDNSVWLLTYNTTTTIRTFDSSLVLLSSNSVFSPHCSNCMISNQSFLIHQNTFLFREMYVDPHTDDTLQGIYDLNDNLVKTIDLRNVVNMHYYPAMYPFSSSDNYLLSYELPGQDRNKAILVLNPDNTIYGRAHISGGVGFFDGTSKIYTLNSWKDKLYIYNIN